MITSRLFDHIRDELGTDRSPALILLILPCIKEMGNDGRHAPCARDLARMNHDEELHERCVGRYEVLARCCGHGRGRAAGGIDDVDIMLAHRLGYPNDRLSAVIARDRRFA